ncbi:MAG TPA: FAD-dependent oxidoreductase, partial [Phycisphaerales bacterium]|nr:FAD-dependent oxidoreductase [Phycisphaerales bacterium]
MDLRSGTPYWAVHGGLLGVYPPMLDDVEADVAVVGAGITGALVAHRLSMDGHRCVVLDRREVGWGSTMGSTALLQYEIDVPLRVLSDRIGPDDARAAYQICATAIDAIDRLTAHLGDRCGFKRCRSLFLANSADESSDFQRECELRRNAGIDVTLLEARQLEEWFGLHRPAAILSGIAAVVEPYRLAHRLLADAERHGSRTFDRTGVVHAEPVGAGWRLVTDRGPQVKAARLVYATGYESAAMLKERIVDLRSTFALATEPVAPTDLPPWLS